jgi:hypothetical protein
MAVVFVLKRLTNPEPGPTPAEKHKAETVTTIAAEDAYQREAHNAGARWARDNPDEYGPILAEVDATFRGAAQSTFGKLARESQLTQRCAKAAGFPDFETWTQQRSSAA